MDYDKLSAAIINLPCVILAKHGSEAEVRAYEVGHRDARHAAAELVNEAAATAPKAAVPDGWRNWLPPKYEAWQDHFGVQRSAKSPDVISLIIERKEIQLYYPEFAYLLEKMLSFVAAATPSPVPADTAELPPLPSANYNGYSDGSEPLYTADQMRDYARATLASRPAPAAVQGEVVVTWDEARTRIVAVTRQDEEGRVLSVIAHAAPAAPSAAQAAGVESLIEAAEDMMKWCVSNVTMWNFSQYDQLHRAVQRVRAATPSEGVAAPVEPIIFYAEQSALDIGQVDMIVSRKASKTFSVPLVLAAPAAAQAAVNQQMAAALRFMLAYENDDAVAIAEIQAAFNQQEAVKDAQEFARCYCARKMRDALNLAAPAAVPQGVDEDGERWRFMMLVADNPNGPEMQAMEQFGNETIDSVRPESVQMVEAVDRARAFVAQGVEARKCVKKMVANGATLLPASCPTCGLGACTLNVDAQKGGA